MGGNDTDDLCICGHSRFSHYCFGGYCLVEPAFFGQGEDGCREFRMDLTLPGIREAIVLRRARAKAARGPW
jgi:hypothetical protein